MDDIWVVYDINGMRWTFDHEQARGYCVEAEEEMIAEGTPTYDEETNSRNNGFYCEGWEDLVKFLNEHGYME